MGHQASGLELRKKNGELAPRRGLLGQKLPIPVRIWVISRNIMKKMGGFGLNSTDPQSRKKNDSRFCNGSDMGSTFSNLEFQGSVGNFNPLGADPKESSAEHPETAQEGKNCAQQQAGGLKQDHFGMSIDKHCHWRQ